MHRVLLVVAVALVACSATVSHAQDPCSVTCGADEYQTAECVEPVSTVFLDYQQDENQPNIDVVGNWQEFDSSSPVSGFFGDTVYLINRVAATGYGKFSFTVDREADYNISISYAYLAVQPASFTPSQRVDVYIDGARAGTFFVNQQEPPPADMLTLLDTFHIVSEGYVFVNATVVDTSATTRTASLDAVQVEPADPLVSSGTPPTCLELRQCYSYEYETEAPTATTNRECALLRNCTVDQYETKAPTATSDRDCDMLAVCNFTSQYIRAQPTPTSDRLCGLLEVCDPDEYERIAPTTTSDRDCKGV